MARRSLVGRIARRRRRPGSPVTPRDPISTADSTAKAIVAEAGPLTMTGPHRLLSVVDAVRYCVERDVPGDFAECGVWRGGSVMAMILTLQSLGIDDREIHLFDTFSGMTRPTEEDTSALAPAPLEEWESTGGHLYGEIFDERSGIHGVRSTLEATDYPANRLHLVEGQVEETIPGLAPERLALLRLDTDWYESTRHELAHLYPRLSKGGVLIIDDYGHWRGCKKAVDEYFSEHAPVPLLSRIDYSGRIGVKV